VPDYSVFKFLREKDEVLLRHPVCLIHGFYEFLGEKVIDRYTRTYLEAKTDFNFRRVYLDEKGNFDWNGLIMELRSSSFFVQSKKLLVVMIRDPQALVIKKADREILKEYLQSPNPHAAMILYVSLPILKDDYQNLKKTKIKALRELLSGPGILTVTLDTLPEGAVVQYVRRELEQMGLRITPDGVEKMLEILGEDPALIIHQLPKFGIYQARDQQIDSRDVEMILTGFQSHSIWDLIRAVEEEDLEGYLGILQYLFMNGYKPVFVLGTLIGHFHKILVAKILLDKRYPVQQIGRLLNQPGFFLQSFIQSVRRFSAGRLARILKVIYRMDYESKTGGENLARLNLQNFLLRLKLLTD